MNKTVKKTILLISALTCIAVTFLLSSCGGNDTSSQIKDTTYYTIEYNRDMDDGKVDVLWGPELFEDMNIDNKHLALLSAGLLAAAGQDGSKEHANDYYITEAYKKLGFAQDRITLFNYPKSKESNVEHASVNDDIKENDVLNVIKPEYTNEHCFAIGDVVMPIDGKESHVIVITMRGTEAVLESVGDSAAKANREFYGKDVYDYFENYSDKVFRGLAYYIKNHPDLKDKPAKVLIAGHSLGGAAANLVGARFDYCIEDQGGNWKDLPWGKGGPQEKEDIAVFTFGALNVFGKDEDGETRGKKFDNIANVFNYYDTFGPHGEGFMGVHPAQGDKSSTRKFGKMIPFIYNYVDEFDKGKDRDKNHTMPGYIRSVLRGIENENGIILQTAKRAYLNKTGYYKTEDPSAPKSSVIKAEEISPEDRAEGVAVYVADQDWTAYHDWRVHLPDAEMGEGPYNDIDVKYLPHVERRIYGDNVEGVEKLVFSDAGKLQHMTKKEGKRGYFDIYFESGVPDISFGKGGGHTWEDYTIDRNNNGLVIKAGVWWLRDPDKGPEKVGEAKIHR